MRYTSRPLSDRTWLRPGVRRSQFTASWTDTLELLSRELKHLGAKDVVIECDVREKDIRNDGMLRSNAVAETPAVVIAFESKHGPLLYRCDQYTLRAWGSKMEKDWQHNVRAIALTLESLRAVDRYGATETGQQYAGFKALPAGRSMPASHMTRTDAAQLLERVAVGEELGPMRDRYIARVMADPQEFKQLRREAIKMTHPDRGGDPALWAQVEQAIRVLEVSA